LKIRWTMITSTLLVSRYILLLVNYFSQKLWVIFSKENSSALCSKNKFNTLVEEKVCRIFHKIVESLRNLILGKRYLI
jgi:hypothetical protein